MGRLSTDRKAYMDSTEEEHRFCPSATPIQKGLASYSDGDRSPSEGEVSTVPSGLKRLASMKRAKDRTELGQCATIPEQEQGQERPQTSDRTASPAGIFPTHSGNPSGPNAFGDAILVTIGEPPVTGNNTEGARRPVERVGQSCNSARRGHWPSQPDPGPAEVVSVSTRIPSPAHEEQQQQQHQRQHQHQQEHQQETQQEHQQETQQQQHLLREVDSFDDEDQFGRRRSPSSSKSSRKRDPSFDFGVPAQSSPDPPTRLIGSFLRKQAESGGSSLDLDLDMDELSSSPRRPRDPGETIPSPQKNTHLAKESSYVDLVRLDQSGAGVSAPGGGNHQPSKGNSELPRQDVAITVGGDEGGHAKVGSPEGAFRAAQNGNAGESEGPGIRWRRNSSFRPASPPVAEVEVLKAPAEYVTRPSFSKLKSRLADIPKPPEVSKGPGGVEDKPKSGQARNSGQMKSGLLGNKLKKVEEDEEDPLKVTDLPEKYRRRNKGFWVWFQWSAFICLLGGLVTVLAFPSLRNMKRGGLALWKWGLLGMVVLSGRLISGWIIWIVVFIIEKNFLLRKRVVYFVYALRKGVQNCLWLGFALLAWHMMIDPKVDNNIKVVKYVSKVLVCFLVAAVIILVKTLMVKVFASSFHVNNYFERIQEALFNQYIMETLSGPPLVEFQMNLEEEKKLAEEFAGLRDAAGANMPNLSKISELPPLNVRLPSGLGGRQSLNLNSGAMGTQSGMIGKSPKAVEVKKNKSKSKAELNEGISVEHLQRLDLSNISAWNMKRLMHIVKHSTLTHSLEETINADGMETEIQSEWQAKCAAKQIFKNVAKPGQKVIMEDDLLRFMREEETKRALPLFDGAVEKKNITKQALKTWVINAYRERRSLALSLNDTKTAVNKLHRIVDVVVGVIIIIIWLLVLGIATTKLLLFMSSQILLLILVWGNTLKTVFEAIVFLFIMHPFDVGDRCVIDGTQYVVEEMNILTTVFLGDFNVKVWFPNSVLATKPIQNYYRSPNMGDGVDLIVHASTPVEKIASFKEKMGRFLTSRPHHWHQDYSLNIMQMTEGDRMKLSLGVKHTMNYQDMGEIVKRRSELLLEVRFCLQELGIEYHLPAQEVHIVRRTDS